MKSRGKNEGKREEKYGNDQKRLADSPHELWIGRNFFPSMPPTLIWFHITLFTFFFLFSSFYLLSLYTFSFSLIFLNFVCLCVCACVCADIYFIYYHLWRHRVPGHWSHMSSLIFNSFEGKIHLGIDEQRERKNELNKIKGMMITEWNL